MKRRMFNGAKKIIKKLLGRRMIRCMLEYNVKRNYATTRFTKYFFTILFILPGIISYFRSTIPYIEMDVTSRCSLSCKECTHFIPVYQNRGMSRDVDVTVLLENIELLMSRIDKCLIFRITGGEPFLYEQLSVVINRLTIESKVKHVEIATNGTVMPGEKVLEALHNKKVTVSISDYGVLSNKKAEIIKILSKRGILVKITGFIWYEANSLMPRNYTEKKVESLFFNCIGSEFKCLFDSKIWLCPQALHGSVLELVETNESEFVDLREHTGKDFMRRLNRLYRYSAKLTTCRNCTGVCPEFSKRVPCAQQITTGSGIAN